MKTEDTMFGKRRVFCGCETRLTKERLNFIGDHLKTITFLDLCERCRYFRFAFKHPVEALKFKKMYNKECRTKEGGLALNDTEGSKIFSSKTRGGHL